MRIKIWQANRDIFLNQTLEELPQIVLIYPNQGDNGNRFKGALSGLKQFLTTET